MTRHPSTTPAARPADAPPPVRQPLLTEEQCNLLLEASAYRYPHWSIGPHLGAGGNFSLDIWAEGRNPHSKIWGGHLLGSGSWAEMTELRKAAMAEYSRLTEGTP